MSEKAMEDEIVQIQHIAAINNLDVDVGALVKRKRLRLLLAETRPPPLSPPSTRTKWLRLPYLGRPAEQLAKELNKYGYKVGFYPLTTISDPISIKDPTPIPNRSGVYRITCGECPATYIGQTSRKLKKRLAEHKKIISATCPSPDKESAVAIHCWNSNHDPKKVTGQLLYQYHKSSTMNRIEEALIVQASTDTNNQLLNNSNTYINPFINFMFNST